LQWKSFAAGVRQQRLKRKAGRCGLIKPYVIAPDINNVVKGFRYYFLELGGYPKKWKYLCALVFNLNSFR